MTLDQFALYIGYTVMVLGGIITVLGLVVLAVFMWWRAQRTSMAWKHVSQALTEWKANHPELAADWQNKQSD